MHGWLGQGFRIPEAHQSHEFLRSRLVAAVAALLRHCATNPWPLDLRCDHLVDPPPGRAVALCHLLDDRLPGFAGRGVIANIDVAIAHDCYPSLKLHHNARLLRKVACDQLVSAAPSLRFTIAEQPELLIHKRKVKKSTDLIAAVSQ